MLALPYLPIIYLKEWSLPPLTHLMHAIYLLQADVEIEVCCDSFGQVYKGHFSSLSLFLVYTSLLWVHVN